MSSPKDSPRLPMSALASLGPVAIHREPVGQTPSRVFVSLMNDNATEVLGALGRGDDLPSALANALACIGASLDTASDREMALLAHLEQMAPVAVWTGRDAAGRPSHALAGLDEKTLFPNHEYTLGPALPECILLASAEAAEREKERARDGRYSIAEEKRVLQARRSLPPLVPESALLRGSAELQPPAGPAPALVAAAPEVEPA